MKYLQLALTLLVCFCLVNCQEKELQKTDLETQKDKVSYSIGLDMGKTLKKQSIEIDPKILSKGLKHGLEKDESDFLLTKEEIREVMLAFQMEMVKKQQEKNKIESEKNKSEGEKFLAENKNKPGVITLPSGLQYKVLKEGSGDKPEATSTITTHYTGKFIDGTVFDSSLERGKPETFALNKVNKGWTEGLQLMEEGAKWELYIPAGLAYGEEGVPGVIGPNATLIFEVELLSIEK